MPWTAPAQTERGAPDSPHERSRATRGAAKRISAGAAFEERDALVERCERSGVRLAVHHVEAGVDGVEAGVDGVEASVDGVEASVDGVEASVEAGVRLVETFRRGRGEERQVGAENADALCHVPQRSIGALPMGGHGFEEDVVLGSYLFEEDGGAFGRGHRGRRFRSPRGSAARGHGALASNRGWTRQERQAGKLGTGAVGRTVLMRPGGAAIVPEAAAGFSRRRGARPVSRTRGRVSLDRGNCREDHQWCEGARQPACLSRSSWRREALSRQGRPGGIVHRDLKPPTSSSPSGRMGNPSSRCSTSDLEDDDHFVLGVRRRAIAPSVAGGAQRQLDPAEVT